MVAPASAHNHLDCALLHCRSCLLKTRESQVIVPDSPRTTQLYYHAEALPPRVVARRYHSLRMSPALHPPERPTPLAASLIGHASQHALPRRRGERIYPGPKPTHTQQTETGEKSVRAANCTPGHREPRPSHILRGRHYLLFTYHINRLFFVG